MIDYLKAAFRNLGRKRTRTALTVLGISIGVASIIVISNISQCGTDTLNTELDSLGLSGISISSNQNGNGQSASLTEEDLDSIRKIGQVEQVSPLMVEDTDITLRDGRENALLWGIDSGTSDIVSLQVLYGRLFSQKEIRTGANVCLVDEALSRSAYGRSNIIGKELSLRCGGVEQPFTVVGIIKTGSGLLQNLIGEYIPTFIYVPYTTVQSAAGREDFDEIAVKIHPGDSADGIGKRIVNLLDRSKGTNGAFVSSNLAKQKDGLMRILDIVTLVLSAVGAISMLVASLSIMTVMLVSVHERTREIGIKKALGATRGAIMLEFLAEAVLLSLVGCLFGLGTGYLISCAGAAYFHVALRMRLDIMLLAAAFSICSGIVFGVYPAYQASKLKPVDALRQE